VFINVNELSRNKAKPLGVRHQPSPVALSWPQPAHQEVNVDSQGVRYFAGMIKPRDPFAGNVVGNGSSGNTRTLSKFLLRDAQVFQYSRQLF